MSESGDEQLKEKPVTKATLGDKFRRLLNNLKLAPPIDHWDPEKNYEPKPPAPKEPSEDQHRSRP